MAEVDLISDYVDDLRRSLRWRRDREELLLELEDHLRSKAEAGRLAGAAEPERATIEEFGSALEVARAFATTSSGGVALPTIVTRRSGAVAIAAAVAWIVSMLTGFLGQGDVLVPWTTRNYALWSMVTALAAILTAIALVGLLIRTGGRFDVGMTAGLGLLLLGVAGSSLLTWAWVFTFLPFSLCSAIVFVRLRSCGLRLRESWWLLAAWPIGSGLGHGLKTLQVGYADDYGDYPVAWVIAYAIASVIFAVALAGIGRALLHEEAVTLPDRSATA